MVLFIKEQGEIIFCSRDLVIELFQFLSVRTRWQGTLSEKFY